MKRLKNIGFLLLAVCLISCNSNYSPTSNSTSSNNEVIKTGLSNVSIIEGSTLDDKDNPLIKWEGRYQLRIGNRVEKSQVYLYHTATGFDIDFEGTYLEVTFHHTQENDIYFDFAIDDESLPNINNRRFFLPKTETETTIVLASDLSFGHHKIRCLKMSEARDAYTSISKFRTDGNFYYRKGIDNNKLKFMCLNASSGSGYGVLSYSEGSSKYSRTTKNSSSLHSYMFMTARRFDADIHYVAQAGWGIRFPSTQAIPNVFDYTGVTPSNNVNGALTTGVWDHSSYVPDVIMMHLGGNDIDRSDFNLTDYKEAVVSFVEKLHYLYPLAKVLWLHTNTDSGGYGFTALEECGAVSKGYAKEVIFPKVGKGETGLNTYGASSHHSFKSHLDASKIITNFISETYHYQVVNEPLTFEQFDFMIEK